MPGQRVFAYVNRRGILAIGRVVDGQVLPGSTIFGKENEFHLNIKWETVVSDDQGVTNREVLEAHNYNLPVRCVFCAVSRHDVAEWIVTQLRERETA